VVVNDRQRQNARVAQPLGQPGGRALRVNEDAALITLEVVTFANAQQMKLQDLDERDILMMTYTAVVSYVAFDVVTRRDHLMSECRRDRVRVGEALQHNDVALSPMRFE
jgi:hypothetical protein